MADVSFVGLSSMALFCDGLKGGLIFKEILPSSSFLFRLSI